MFNTPCIYQTSDGTTTKVYEVLHRGISWGVRELIKKQITESVSNPQDEFIKPN